VTDEDRRAILLRESALGGSHVIGKRGQRILHRRHLVALGLKQRDHLAPAGAVREGAVDQHDVLHGCGLRRQRRQGQRQNRHEFFHGSPFSFFRMWIMRGSLRIREAHPKVKTKTSDPGSRNSISKVRDSIGGRWRISWYIFGASTSQLHSESTSLPHENRGPESVRQASKFHRIIQGG
jgi:hypothetical protein